MLNPANDLAPSPSSPTISTLSSSDLDTEVTWFFTHMKLNTLLFHLHWFFFTVNWVVLPRPEHHIGNSDGGYPPGHHFPGGLPAPPAGEPPSQEQQTQEERRGGAAEAEVVEVMQG